MKSLRDYKPYEVIYVDAMNLLTRSFYGMRELEYKGHKTGMLYGVARLFLDWTKKAPGVDIVMLWEGRDSWRRVKYPIYKAHRGESRSPEETREFYDSIERVKYALPSMGIKQAWCNTYEADDVVATLAKGETRRALFSSGDWDWWELADYGDILYQHKDVLTGEDMKVRFEKKFKAPAVPPSMLWLFKVLTGDPSDNVSGVPRFPKKVASRLCNLEGVNEDSIVHGLARLGEKRWAEKVVENYWLVRRNIELIQASDVPLDSIEWVGGEYSKEVFGDVLLKSGMEALHDRLIRG